MEPHFQTSFIPKRPLTSNGQNSGMNVAQKQHHGVASVFMIIAVLIFIASLAAVGGAYAWKQYLISAQAGYKQDLAKREQQFNLDLIEQLKEVNVKIDTARQLLSGHLALSGIFDILGKFTIGHVRFQSLDVTAPTNGTTDIKISMHGYGTSLQAVAFQSDVLSQLEQYGLRNIVKNPILADPSLSTDGTTVAFDFTATIDPATLSYEKSVTGDTSGVTTGDTTTGSAAPTSP